MLNGKIPQPKNKGIWSGQEMGFGHLIIHTHSNYSQMEVGVYVFEVFKKVYLLKSCIYFYGLKLSTFKLCVVILKSGF